ncbi:hypothetical protein LZ31DRAFT_235338 [Colletotrichum somersetense]|nr:hypothetical protein LZ31DRAFT_235338 [Colletotrichum somersetense]
MTVFLFPRPGPFLIDALRSTIFGRRSLWRAREREREREREERERVRERERDPFAPPPYPQSIGGAIVTLQACIFGARGLHDQLHNVMLV